MNFFFKKTKGPKLTASTGEGEIGVHLYGSCERIAARKPQHFIDLLFSIRD